MILPGFLQEFLVSDVSFLRARETLASPEISGLKFNHLGKVVSVRFLHL